MSDRGPDLSAVQVEVLGMATREWKTIANLTPPLRRRPGKTIMALVVYGYLEQKERGMLPGRGNHFRITADGNLARTRVKKNAKRSGRYAKAMERTGEKPGHDEHIVNELLGTTEKLAEALKQEIVEHRRAVKNLGRDANVSSAYPDYKEIACVVRKLALDGLADARQKMAEENNYRRRL